jgi:hypothetical protein
MPDDRPLMLRQADQARTNFALESESRLEFRMGRIAAPPRRRELARLAFVIMLAAGSIGIVGIEAFWLNDERAANQMEPAPCRSISVFFPCD